MSDEDFGAWARQITDRAIAEMTRLRMELDAMTDERDAALLAVRDFLNVKREVTRLRSLLEKVVVDGAAYFDLPHCPNCGSVQGSLGTGYAYFVCAECQKEVYWTPDRERPGDWDLAVATSPWARARRRLEEADPGRAQPTVAECAAFIRSGGLDVP